MNRDVKILLVEDDSNLGSITSDYLIAKALVVIGNKMENWVINHLLKISTTL